MACRASQSVTLLTMLIGVFLSSTSLTCTSARAPRLTRKADADRLVDRGRPGLSEESLTGLALLWADEVMFQSIGAARLATPRRRHRGPSTRVVRILKDYGDVVKVEATLGNQEIPRSRLRMASASYRLVLYVTRAQLVPTIRVPVSSMNDDGTGCLLNPGLPLIVKRGIATPAYPLLGFLRPEIPLEVVGLSFPAYQRETPHSIGKPIECRTNRFEPMPELDSSDTERRGHCRVKANRLGSFDGNPVETGVLANKCFPGAEWRPFYDSDGGALLQVEDQRSVVWMAIDLDALQEDVPACMADDLDFSSLRPLGHVLREHEQSDVFFEDGTKAGVRLGPPIDPDSAEVFHGKLCVQHRLVAAPICFERHGKPRPINGRRSSARVLPE